MGFLEMILVPFCAGISSHVCCKWQWDPINVHVVYDWASFHYPVKCLWQYWIPLNWWIIERFMILQGSFNVWYFLKYYFSVQKLSQKSFIAWVGNIMIHVRRWLHDATCGQMMMMLWWNPFFWFHLPWHPCAILRFACFWHCSVID